MNELRALYYNWRRGECLQLFFKHSWLGVAIWVAYGSWLGEWPWTT